MKKKKIIQSSQDIKCRIKKKKRVCEILYNIQAGVAQYKKPHMRVVLITDACTSPCSFSNGSLVSLTYTMCED